MPPATQDTGKSARKSAPGRPFTPGDPRRGRGPKKGAPNAGRPPDAIRAACRASFDARIATLTAFADDDTLDPSVRMKAIETLAKYGLGTTSENAHAHSGPAGEPIAVTVTHTVVDPSSGH
jgi:hypothetical protein